MLSNGRNERTRILSHLLLICFLTSAIPIALQIGSENASAATTYTWSAAGNDYAGISTSWTPNGVPGAGDTVIFDATSVTNCNWNITPTLAAFYMLTGYSGTVTQAASFGVSVTYTQQAGTFTGGYASGYWLNDSGSWTKTGGILTSMTMQLNMTGTGTISTNDTAGNEVFSKLVIYGTVTNPSGGTIVVTGYGSSARGLSIFGTLSISYGMTLTYNTASAGSGVFLNAGAITGLGTLNFNCGGAASSTLTFGTISCQVSMWNSGVMSADVTAVLGSNTILGSNLTVYSSHATKLMTLSHGSNYQLTVAGAVVLGTRGIMTQGTGTWTFGSYTQNGASSVFTEAGNVIIGMDLSLSVGTLTGTSSVTYAMSVGGNFTKTGGTLTSEKLNLNMTGTGTISVDTAQQRFYKITIQGTTTYASGGQYIWPRSLSGGTVVTGTLSISYGMTWRVWLGGPFTNTGIITGLGTLEFAWSGAAPQTITFGTINCPVLFDHEPASGNNGVVNLGANTVLGSNLTITPVSGQTFTLSHNSNYQLTVNGGLVLNDRGIMTQGTGAWSFGSYTQSGASSVFTQAGDVTVNGGVLVSAGTFTQSSSHNWTVNVSGSGVVFGVTGGLMRLADNMTINPGCSASLLNNSFVMNQLINYGTITQNGKRLNISGSSATPLTGYGTFDGDLYLNGSAASSYEVQASLPMGHLYTDRDTTISISPSQYLRVAPSSTDFIDVVISNIGPESGYDARWAVDSVGAVTYTVILAPNQLYEAWVDEAVRIGTYQADSNGVIQFTYDGPFSSHSFTVQDVRSLPCTLWASFTYLIDGLEVEFIDTTYAQPTRVIWTFGDGWGSMNPYPTHKYENSGTYRVVMRAYDEYGHSNMVETLITVNLGPSTPLEHTDTGWSMYWNNDTVISVSAVGLLISGAISLVSTWYMPTIPIVTKKARRLYGVLAILAGMYFFIFVKGIVNVGVFG